MLNKDLIGVNLSTPVRANSLTPIQVVLSALHVTFSHSETATPLRDGGPGSALSFLATGGGPGAAHCESEEKKKNNSQYPGIKPNQIKPKSSQNRIEIKSKS